MQRDVTSTPGLVDRRDLCACRRCQAQNDQGGSTEEVGSALGTGGGQLGRRRGGAPGSSGARSIQKTPWRQDTATQPRSGTQKGGLHFLSAKAGWKAGALSRVLGLFFFCKGLESKYFWFPGPYSLCLSHSPLLV